MEGEQKRSHGGKGYIEMEAGELDHLSKVRVPQIQSKVDKEWRGLIDQRDCG
jgi:hypothetical protein